MAFEPWTQQKTGTKLGEEPPVEKEAEGWWGRGKKRFEEAGGWTWPWEEKHWTAPQPEWTRTVGKIGLGTGLTAAGIATGMALPGGLSTLSGLKGLSWLTRPALAAMSHPTAIAAAGGAAGLYGSAAMGNVPSPAPPGEVGGAPGAAPPGAVPPTAPTEEPSVLPQPGDEMAAGQQPVFFTDESGMRWVYNDYTGAWTQVQAPITRGPTVEQQAGISEEERAHQLAMLQEQYRLEQGAMAQQSESQRGMQQAGAAQQMAQMYAADPYKYWAQMGQGTPGAVSRLTGGEVGPGEQMQPGVPLSMPSQQWWQNLLPSEQQQISGGLNWLGQDPQDWYAMQQRMIPGLGQRQMGPQWAR